MNRAQLKCLAVFSVFAIIGFGPVSPGCLIGMYVVITRPRWFLELARGVYAIGNGSTSLAVAGQSEPAWPVRKKCFLSLLCLFLVDIAPVPVTPTVAFVILLARPWWFYRMVETIYSDQPESVLKGHRMR